MHEQVKKQSVWQKNIFGITVKEALLSLFYVAVLCFFIELLARQDIVSTLLFLIQKPHFYLFEVALFTLFFGLIRSIFNQKKYFVFFITATLACVLGVVSKIKLDFRGTGASIQDLYVMREAFMMAGSLSFWVVVGFIGIGLALAVFTFLWVRKIQLAPISRNKRTALGAICLTLMFLVVAFSPDLGTMLIRQTKVGLSAKDTGAAFYFCAQFKVPKSQKPVVSDVLLKQRADEALQTYSDMEIVTQNGPVGEQPDVIVLQMESFFDVTKELGMDSFSQDPLPFFHKFSQEAALITGTSPSYAGDTSNVEFEVLTGISMAMFPEGTNVYTGNLTEPAISIASVLRSQGYSTKAIHPYHSLFYNRPRAYQLMGLHQFISMESMKKENPSFEQTAYPFEGGLYPSDKELSRQIIDAFEKNEGNPQFIFGVSVQTHVPFLKYNDGDYKVAYTKNDLSQEVQAELEGYVSNLMDADEAMEALVSYLRTREKETVLVIYGDHQPSLECFAYSNSMQGDEKQVRHEVPVLLWNNKKQIKVEEQTVDMTSLSEITLTLSGAEMPNYYKILHQLRLAEKVGAFRRDYAIIDGQYYFPGEEEYQRIYSVYEVIYECAYREKAWIEPSFSKWLIADNKDFTYDE